MNFKRTTALAVLVLLASAAVCMCEDSDGAPQKVTAERTSYDGTAFVLEFREGLTGEFNCRIFDGDGNRVTPNDYVFGLHGDRVVIIVPPAGVTIHNGNYSIVMNSKDVFVAEMVEVEVPVKDIVLDRESVSVTVGKGVQLHASVEPSEAFDRNLVWTSGDPSVASVNEGGYVTGKSPGKTVVTAQASNGVKASCTVTVDDLEPISISVDGSFRTQYSVGESFDPAGMKVTAAMEDGSTRDVTSGCRFSPDSFGMSGSQTVTVSYSGLFAYVDVIVSAGDSPEPPRNDDGGDGGNLILPIAVCICLLAAGAAGIVLMRMRHRRP